MKHNDGNVARGVGIGIALALPVWVALALALTSCYPAATWCTRERPCTGDPVTRDTTVADTTGGTHGR